MNTANTARPEAIQPTIPATTTKAVSPQAN